MLLTGLKYATENETDLKDKMDFVENDPHHFPPGGKLVHQRDCVLFDDGIC